MNKPITLDNLDRHVRFRAADVNDTPELMGLYERFYQEAAYKDFLDYSPERVRMTISGELASGARLCILAIIEQDIVGFIAYILDTSFSVQPCQVLQELYVVPEQRHGAIGRALVALAIQEGQDAGASAFHAPIASGMRSAWSLRNLFLKAGFSDLGFIMRKGL